MGRLARAFIEMVRLVFTRDRLEAAPPSAPLPERGALGSFFFARDTLSVLPPAQPRKGSQVARMLFAPEKLPLDPPAPGRPRSPWLGWLFAREPLDPP